MIKLLTYLLFNHTRMEPDEIVEPTAPIIEEGDTVAPELPVSEQENGGEEPNNPEA